MNTPKQPAYEPADIRHIFRTMLAMTPQQLDEIDASPKATALEKATIAAIKKAIRLGRFKAIDAMIKTLNGAKTAPEVNNG
jgi:hypothetical protein